MLAPHPRFTVLRRRAPRIGSTAHALCLSYIVARLWSGKCFRPTRCIGRKAYFVVPYTVGGKPAGPERIDEGMRLSAGGEHDEAGILRRGGHIATLCRAWLAGELA